jgi:hypothetical protein
LAELTQKSDGTWTEFRSDDPNFSKVTVRSCASWLTLPPAEIRVGAYQIVPFNLQIDVPAGTRGFYFAALVGTTTPRLMPTDTGQLAPVNMQITVPIILEVQSQPMLHQIALTDVGLSFQALTSDSKPTDTVTIDITNSGGTLSRVQPFVRIVGQEGTHWKKLGDVKLTEIMIMPGVKLHLQQKVGQVLPSGNYQVEGQLYVDSRRGPNQRKTVKYVGDPTLANTMVGMVSLTLLPSPLLVDIASGATRSTSLQVISGSDEDITVNAELILPEHMQSAMSSQGIKGDDLGCQGWVTLNPTTFPLRGHTRRNVMVIAKTPKELLKYPYYYATLRLHASYADGKPAGMKEVLICAQNKQVKGTPAVGATVLTISAGNNPGRYLASASYSNTSETHATSLACQGILSKVGAGGGGAAIVKRFLMSSETLYGQTGMLLPFDVRSFSGDLDLSDVDPGRYYLTAAVKWTGGSATGAQKQIVIEVTEQGGRKTACMVEAGESTQVIQL